MKKMNEYFKITNENLMMIVLAFMSFSIGIWGNYRQLWLEDYGFSVTKISRILSIALICSAVIAFIISLCSSKIKIKSVVLESITFRAIAMCILLFNPSEFTVKTCVLLTIMCEVIFSISYYPLLTFISKSDETFRKKSTVDYFAKDAGIISCGLLIGVSVGKIVFDYNSCLFISLITNMCSGIVLLLYENNEKSKNKTKSLVKSVKNIFSSKTNNVYLLSQLMVNISYGIIFDLIMLILTNYINFSVSFASIFIIVCNVLGSLGSSYFNRKADKISVKKGTIIKFGSRAVAYFLAFMTNNFYVIIFSIVVGFITSRLLEDKVTGAFLNLISNDDQFLYGNIKYFVSCLGEGIGAFLAGILLNYSFKILFLGAAVITFIQTILIIYADSCNKNKLDVE